MARRPWADVVDRANADARQPVLFIPGPGPAAPAWDRWAATFEAAGYTALTPPWPADLHGGASGEAVARAALYFAQLVQGLSSRPAIIGHAFGGLVAQVLAGDGLSAASVAVDPAPFPREGVVQVDTLSEPRGPLLITAGGPDAFEQDAAEAALAFIQRFI